MEYIVQENCFRDVNYDNIIHTLERLELPYQIVKVLPFVEDFDVETKTNNVFPFGSLKLARLSKQKNWVPGSLMTDNHDYRIYKDYYGDNLLNYDSHIIKFGDELPLNDTYFFARPCEDTKTFTGQMFSRDSWIEFRNYHLTNGHTTLLNKDTAVQVCKVKNIQKEFRFWIIKGEVITGSQYRLGDSMYVSAIIDQGAIDFCKEMVKLYQLADAFVMDICLFNDKWKIVECGCINCAGFYEADLQKIVIALEENFNTI
jgi:hypothetical protein